jgi:hypothetical protein
LLPLHFYYKQSASCVSEYFARQEKGHSSPELVQDLEHLFTVFMRNYDRFILGEKEAKSLVLMIMTEKG